MNLFMKRTPEFRRLFHKQESIKQGAAHSFEFFDLFPEDVLRQFKMSGETGNAVERFCPAVDHLPGHGNVILPEDDTAADTAERFIHGRVPSCTDTASYRDREP